MAIVFSDTQIPLPPGFPLPSPTRYNAANFYYAARLYFDDAVNYPGQRPLVVYFHGSSATTYLTGPLLNALCAEGYQVLAIMTLGVLSPSNPFRYGYGNVSAPHFTAHFIKDAFWVEAAMSALNLDDPSGTDVVALGHSRGAAACLAWAAGYSGRTSFPARLKGVFASGATVAGLGDLSWNDMNRNINTMSGIVNLLKPKTVMAYGNIDAYGPPDYSRRLQMALPEGVTDKYFVTPGDAPHEWTNMTAYAPLAAMWVKQLLTGATITDKDGNPAIAGPVAA